MEHKLHEVTGFKLLPPDAIEVQFDDGMSQKINLDGVLEGPLYGPLKNPALFAKVKLDPETRNLVWPNGADFDPEILHDWPRRKDDLLNAARKWKVADVKKEVSESAFTVQEICLYVVVGLVAGVLSKFFSQPDSHDLLARIILATAGSLGGGLCRRFIPRDPSSSAFQPLPMASAALGALIFVLIASKILG
jgi:uncharacterized membrane protein YeaQ/YmgE (transglycosylase-associated protein family)